VSIIIVCVFLGVIGLAWFLGRELNARRADSPIDEDNQ
jgi:hypothetical protein